MKRVFSYLDFYSINESTGGKKYGLCPLIWDKEEGKSWEIDPKAKRKFFRIAKEFYSEFKSLLKQRDIYDIQITGSIANLDWNSNSEIDIHVLVNFDDIDKGNLRDIKNEIESICFEWDLKNNPKFKGHDIDLFVQDKRDPHSYSALYSLMNNKWIKAPNEEEIEIDDRDADKKYDSIVFSIERLETIFKEIQDKEKVKKYYRLGLELKRRIQKIKKSYDSSEDSFSVEGMVYKKLKNSGYIEKLIEILAYAYERIF